MKQTNTVKQEEVKKILRNDFNFKSQVLCTEDFHFYIDHCDSQNVTHIFNEFWSTRKDILEKYIDELIFIRDNTVCISSETKITVCQIECGMEYSYEIMESLNKKFQQLNIEYEYDMGAFELYRWE